MNTCGIMSVNCRYFIGATVCRKKGTLLWPLCRQAIMFCRCGFFLSPIFIFVAYSQRLQIGFYHTSTHDVALVRNCEFSMQVWNVPHAACWKYTTQKSPKICHLRTTHKAVFATKACIDNRKNLLNNNISSTYHHNMPWNFGPLTAEIGWRVWGTPTNFNGSASWLRYCTDVAQRRSTRLCTMFGRLLG